MNSNNRADAELIKLALKHKNSIVHRPELYYTIVPDTGFCGIACSEDLSIGEMIDLWDQVPDTISSCPKCLSPALFIRFSVGLSMRFTCFICPECGEVLRYNSNLPNSTDLFGSIREIRKTYADGVPQRLDWYTTFRDEMKHLEAVGEPVFDTPRLLLPTFDDKGFFAHIHSQE